MQPVLADKAQFDRYEARARIIKALGHPARLVIMDALANGELCVCEIQPLLGLDMSTVSTHLAILRNTGLVSSEKRGNQVFYSLQVSCVPRLLDCIESVVRSNAERQLRLT